MKSQMSYWQVIWQFGNINNNYVTLKNKKQNITFYSKRNKNKKRQHPYGTTCHNIWLQLPEIKGHNENSESQRKCSESSFICFVEFCNVTFPLDSLSWALFSVLFFISFSGGARELPFLSVATMTELFYRFTKTNIMCYTPNQPASSQFWWHFYYFSVFLLFFLTVTHQMRSE